MRQIFKRTLILVPLLALLAAPAKGSGQSGRSWDEKYDTIPASRMPDGNIAWWNSIFGAQLCCSDVIQEWRSLAAQTEKWHTNEDCQAAMGYTRDALAEADIQIGSGTSNLLGEYFGDEDVIVVAMRVALAPDGFGTLIHEAWHKGTKQDDDDIKALNEKLDTLFNGRTLESCHDEAREEEDEDDPGDPGGGGDPDPKNCDEKLEWVPPVTTERFEKPPSTQGTRRSLPGVPGVDPIPIPGITVSAESKGEWVTVVLKKGYWKTVTVCED